MKMNRFISVMVVGLALGLAAGCSPKAANVFQGYIEGEYVYVAAPLSGTLTNLAVARGSEAKAGQLLFRPWNAVRKPLPLDEAKKICRGRRPTSFFPKPRSPAGCNCATIRAVISAEELDQARAQRDADRAQMEAQTAALDKARWSFDQKEQSAPTNAFVQDTLYRAGEWVAAGSPVVELLPPANLKVRFLFPRRHCRQSSPAKLWSVTFDGGPHAYPATINYISTDAEFTPPVIYSRGKSGQAGVHDRGEILPCRCSWICDPASRWTSGESADI